MLPARSTNGYIWIGVPDAAGYPQGVKLAGGSRVQAIPQLTGNIDDPDGEAHLVGVTTRMQSSALGGVRIEIVY